MVGTRGRLGTFAYTRRRLARWGIQEVVGNGNEKSGVPWATLSRFPQNVRAATSRRRRPASGRSRTHRPQNVSDVRPLRDRVEHRRARGAEESRAVQKTGIVQA
jgi:hypothetical protein